jgi:hypothetical protein
VQSEKGKQRLSATLGRQRRGGLWVRFMVVIIKYYVSFRLLLPSCNGSLAQELLLIPKRVKLLLAADGSAIITANSSNSRRSSHYTSSPIFQSIAARIGGFCDISIKGKLTRLRAAPTTVVATLADKAAVTGTVVILRAADDNDVRSAFV